MSDIDAQSLVYARANVARNALEGRIAVVTAEPEGSIFGPIEAEKEIQFDFTMCNPPFYASAEDIAQSAATKELGPNAVCTGAAVEMITSGGEGAFVARMIDNYAITEFVQGQTRRWAIAWSFGHDRLPDSLARLSSGPLQSLMPTRNTCRRSFTFARMNLLSRLEQVLNNIEGLSHSNMSPSEDRGSGGRPSSLLVSVARDTWSRAARRKKQRGSMDTSLDNDTSGLICSVKVLFDEEGREGSEIASLECTWIHGRERALFESFWGHICRKVGEVSG
ncbi:hypothetical protein HWV62_41100 [Athelia sp. TMB]|nr:hypothetical protein HWV62_41100 [Athelia sp. TMB]